MQQPPDPSSQYPQQQGQQPPFQPQQYEQPSQYPLPPTPGQFQYPPPPVPPERPSGFSNWFRTRSRRTKLGLGCGTIAAALLLCICAVSVYGSSTAGTRLTPTPTTGHVATLNTPTHTPTLPPTPTQQATPTTQPTPTPTACQAVNNNPWCYNFVPGNLIYNPPTGFCNYFNCIPSFVEPDDPGDGYIVECNDGMYSQSGGESGACSHHGGVMQPLYSH